MSAQENVSIGASTADPSSFGAEHHRASVPSQIPPTVKVPQRVISTVTSAVAGLGPIPVHES
jgi:hypothetical protein